MKELIEFDWDKYQSGEYEAVYRGYGAKIIKIEADPNPDDFYKYIVYGDDARHIGYHMSLTGKIYEFETNKRDVLLRKK